MSVLEVHQLSKSFKGLAVVQDISFSVEEAQVYGFLGPNGSGKTTTLGMVLGVTRPTAGTISVLGSKSNREFSTARRNIGGILEQPNFYPHLSGLDNLRIVASIKSRAGKEANLKQVKETLELVKLASDANRPFKNYSLGMKQRLAIASTLLGKPALLIWDEPANGLDPEGMQEVRELIQLLASRGMTILMSSHILNEVERVCSHVGIIKSGLLLRSGAVRDVVQMSARYRLQAPDHDALMRALTNYENLALLEQDNGSVVVELKCDEPASLNQFLAERNIYLSCLTPLSGNLEHEFMRLTSASGSEAERSQP